MGTHKNIRGAGLLGAGLLALLFAGSSSAAFAQAPAAGAPAADPREARIEQLEAEVQALADQVADLKRAQAAQIVTLAGVEAKTPPPPTALVSITGGKPAITSADGKFSANFHGVAQLDLGQYNQKSAGPTATDLRRSGPAIGYSASNVDLTHARDLKNGDNFRRARIGIDGVAFGDFDYRVLFDFAGTGTENAGQLYETWIQYNGFKPIRVRVGEFAPSFGLEDAASTNGTVFLERPGSSDTARNLAGGDTRTAVQLFGYGDHWLAAAAVTGRTVGVVNSGTVVTLTSTPSSGSPATVAVGTAQTYGDQLGFTGRLAGTPLYGSDWLIHVGAHGSYVARPANVTGPDTTGVTPLKGSVIRLSDITELRVDGTKLVDTGNINARHAYTGGVEFAAQKQSLFLEAEYERFHIDRSDVGLSSPSFDAFYVEGSWIITGEARKYNAATAAFDAPPVAHPFNPKKGAWGAFELGLRYSDLNLNYHAGAAGAAPAADAIRGGDQQIMTAGLNWYLNPLIRFMFDYQHVKIDRLSPSASTYSTTTGAQIGQSYDAFAVRSQLAF
ncbi:MAG: porin [Caulobacteraceae bacterium]|nr:porin [Caulobacteraceae bacterium]